MLEAAIGRMRGRGYKATPQRLAVLRALAEEQHQSLEEIRVRCPEVGLVTVYRALDLLGGLGIVRRLDLGDGARYELARDHHHMICESCGAANPAATSPSSTSARSTRNFCPRKAQTSKYGPTAWRSTDGAGRADKETAGRGDVAREHLCMVWEVASVNAVLVAVLAAVDFSAASLLALLGRDLRAKGRSYSAAFAAGLLLALAFADLFPEGLELAGEPAIAGFVGGFTLLFLTEALTRAHTHHSLEERVRKHALGQFVLGLTIHNLADGFVLGVGAEASAITSGLVGLGILVHQVPVGISLAAVLVAARASGARVVRTTVALGLTIPFAVALTVALPVPGEETLGLLIGVAGGVLAYLGAAHLLPEAQAEHPDKVTGVLLAATLVITTIVLMSVLGG